MLTNMLFKQTDFVLYNNYINDLTDNTIIICDSFSVKNYVTNIFKKLLNGKYKEENTYLDYTTQPDLKDLEIDVLVDNERTTFLSVDGEQDIVVSVDSSFLFKANSAKDVWFAQKDEESGKIYFASLEDDEDFKNSNEDFTNLYIELND